MFAVWPKIMSKAIQWGQMFWLLLLQGSNLLLFCCPWSLQTLFYKHFWSSTHLSETPSYALFTCGLLSPLAFPLSFQFLSLIWSHLTSIFEAFFLFLILDSTCCYFPVCYNHLIRFSNSVSLPIKYAKEWSLNSWVYESQMGLHKVRSFVNSIFYKNVNFTLALTFSFLKNDWACYLEYGLFCFPNCDCFQWVWMASILVMTYLTLPIMISRTWEVGPKIFRLISDLTFFCQMTCWV